MLATFAPLAEQVNMVFAAGKRTIAEPRDLEAMEARRTRALARLGRG